MAELLSKDMLADLVINIINIVILFLVTKKLLYKPVKKYLDERKEKVAKSFAEAEDIKNEALKLKSDYENVLENADSIKKTALQEAQNKAREEAEKILSSAKKQADDYIEQTRKTAEAEKKNLLKAEKEDIANAALAISGKILAREVSDGDNRAIIDSFFA